MRSLARIALALAALLAGCGDQPSKTPQGGISDVSVVLKGTSQPLPFDPRGGRLTIITGELAKLLGHPVVLELDTALAPELKASLEETVLASFEGLTRELVLLKKEDPEMFAKARRVERVVCMYDSVAHESKGALHEDGKVLVVRSPPDRFPLLEPWIVTSTIYDAFVADLDARWGDADPTRLSAGEQAPYFAYMMKTRPGAGYLWVAARAKRPSAPRWEDLRAEHLERIVKLAGTVDPGNPLARKVRRSLLESAPYATELGRGQEPSRQRVARAYESWLSQNVGRFDDDERLLLERAFESAHSSFRTGAFPGFDRLAFGLSVFDAWVKDGAPVEPQATPRGELYKKVVCPVKRRPLDDPDREREIRYGCSRFFASVLEDEAQRRRLAETIAQRRDTKLLETALLNPDSKGGPHVVALVEALKDDTLFRHGVKLLFHDHARRDDVKHALEEAAPRWWRDMPDRRGLTLLVIARGSEHLDVHYGDNQWTRFVGEFGGPIKRDVFSAFLAEGTRAIEMAPRMWPALAKGQERDDLIAKNLPVLLARDVEARSARTRPVLALLRTRLCEEKNAVGLATIHAALERWRRDHPDDGASVSNALKDFTLARCAAPPPPAD